MTGLLGRHRGAVALATALLVASIPAVAAAKEEPPAVDDGGVEIPYLESTEIKPGEGWQVDCNSRLPATLEKVTITCSEASVALAADFYDAVWGEHPLALTLVNGDTRIEVTYRVRLAKPPVAEIAADRIDLPIPVAAQAVIPLSALGITCAACSVEGGATVRVGALPDQLDVGVSPTHLSVRSGAAGDRTIPLAVTDDAGQSVETELRLTFVPGTGRAIPTWQVMTSDKEVELEELVSGRDLTVVCDERNSIMARCERDGTVQFSGDAPGQLFFRVSDEEGRLGWGSVTFDADAESTSPIAPAWGKKASMQLVSVPVDAQGAALDAPLAGLAKLLEGVPGS